MPRKRNEEADLVPYMREAKSWLEYEHRAIEDFEFLCTLWQHEVAEDIAGFMAFFKSHLYLNYPRCLIELYEAGQVCLERFGKPTAQTIVDYTAFRFQRYYCVLVEGGYLHE